MRPGAAACGPEYEFGTVILFEWGAVICLDRFGSHVDATGRIDRWFGSGTSADLRRADAWGIQRQLGYVVLPQP